MDSSKTPIALFTFNRPEHTHRILSAVARCGRIDECRLFIYCDGPRNQAQSGSVQALRSVVRQWAPRLSAEVVERSHNLGLARSIVTGVTELTQQYGRVIVIEDDLVISPDFFDFMLQALDRYQDDAQIYQISGYMFPVSHPSRPDAFFLPLTTTWGWATWARAWSIFDWNATGWSKRFADPDARRRFDLDTDSRCYSTMLEQRLAGQNDSWGILWWYAVFNAGGLVLHPRLSLVWNGGFDGSGVHCEKATDPRQPLLEEFAHVRLPKPLVLPTRVSVDVEAFNRVKGFFQGRTEDRRVSLANRIWRLMRKMVP
jgi:hypothetical protein